MSGTIIQAIASIFTSPRSIGDSMVPDCAIEENHQDEIAITEHPVEQGASITDHAYIKPAEVTLRWGWSNSSPANAGSLFGLLPSFGAASEQYIKDVYDNLLTLQQTRKLLTIVTGKRKYDNMLIQSLSTRTDNTSEYALIIIAKCRQIIIVQTSAVEPGTAPENQAAPQETQPPAQTGEQPATPAASPPRPSVLRSVLGS